MKKILIVDDAQFMQKATSWMLSSKYETVCASSGEEAIEIYEKEKPDMILTDLIMPGMTGLELQHILQDKYSEHVPIMFMTADENEENERLILEGGAMDFIRKPFKREFLLKRVDNIMRHVENIRGLKMVAEKDPMTGLLNKAYAQKELGEVCAKSAGVLMMVDLDSFKLVNDIYGHEMGDKVLIRFSEIIRAVIRSSDIAGRVGGDEFIVFCREITKEAIVAEKTRQINEMLLLSAKEFMGENMNIPLGASVGAVLVPDEGTDFTYLYKKADKALYRVKQNGKHGYAFYKSIAAQSDSEKGKGATSSLENIRMILDERNRQRGAYELGFENFKSVYRFVIRSIENYHKTIALVLLTVGDSGQAGTSDGLTEDAMDQFSANLKKSLRRSDIYTKNGKNQYIVLLSEIKSEDGEPALKRILDNWKKTGMGNVKISYETSIIKGSEE